MQRVMSNKWIPRSLTLVGALIYDFNVEEQWTGRMIGWRWKFGWICGIVWLVCKSNIGSCKQYSYRNCNSTTTIPRYVLCNQVSAELEWHFGLPYQKLTAANYALIGFVRLLAMIKILLAILHFIRCLNKLLIITLSHFPLSYTTSVKISSLMHFPFNTEFKLLLILYQEYLFISINSFIFLWKL